MKITQEQLAAAFQLYRAGASVRKVAEGLAISGHVLRHYFRRSGLPSRTRAEATSIRLAETGHGYTDEQKADILARYQRGENTQTIGRLYNRSRASISSVLRWNGARMRTTGEAQRRDWLKENAFDEINEQSAYWIGFLMADGCVRRMPEGAPMLVLELAMKDAEHVFRFRESLGSIRKVQLRPAYTGEINGRATNCTGGVSFSVSSQRLVDALAKYGVVPRKTWTAEVKLLALNRHFWRGAVDGDGSLYFTTRAKDGKRFPRITFYGNEALVRQFQEFAAPIAGCPGGFGRQSTGIYWNYFGGSSSAIKLVSALYSNCTVALPRKLAKAQEFMAWTAVHNQEIPSSTALPLT